LATENKLRLLKIGGRSLIRVEDAEALLNGDVRCIIDAQPTKIDRREAHLRSAPTSASLTRTLVQSSTPNASYRTRSASHGVTNDPGKFLERVNLRFSLASIALPNDARAVVERVLSLQPFDQEAKQCHVSPHARDR
jgi:hypothetical protein